MSNRPHTEADEPIFDHVPPGRTETAGQVISEGKGRIFPCEGCGADLKFNIGQQQMLCPFCGHEKQISWEADQTVEEQDFHAMLAKLVAWREEGEPDLGTTEDEQQEISCASCSATVVFVGTLTSSLCPYCASPLQREKGHKAEKRIPVDGVLPFKVSKEIAKRNLTQWVKSRWFAPNLFYRKGAQGSFEGVYLPYWTFDSLTFTQYTGQRGDNYTVTVGTGKNRRTVTRTRWSYRSGSFERFFDDVLVIASRNMNLDLVQGLEPWPLHQCIPFKQEVLAGLYARTYEVDLDEGFEHGRKIVENRLDRDVRSRIGGDQQRVSSMDVNYNAITYKHLLLPVWLLSYRFQDKLYQVMVNAATGEVQGQRPWSWVKITLLILAILLVTGILFLLSGAAGSAHHSSSPF